MRIAIDIRALQLETQYRGVGTYVRELILKFLARQRQLVLLAWPGMRIGLENQFLNACQLLELPKPSSWPWAEFNGYQRDGQDKDLFFKKLAQHVDLIHFPCAQDLRYGFPWHDVGAPRLITVHDLLGFSNPELAWSEEILPRRLLFKVAYRKMIQHYLECNGILTNSQFTEHMVRASLKNNLPTIRTVLLGISDRYVLPYVSQVDEYRLQRKLPPRFILHVGGLTGAKNVEALLLLALCDGRSLYGRGAGRFSGQVPPAADLLVGLRRPGRVAYALCGGQSLRLPLAYGGLWFARLRGYGRRDASRLF